jgi:hypothetical protein
VGFIENDVKMCPNHEMPGEVSRGAEAEGSYELNKFLLAEHQNLIIHKAVFKFESNMPFKSTKCGICTSILINSVNHSSTMNS